MLWIVISLLFLLLGIRTACWHLRCWQLREYRLDRLKAWLRTDDGKVFWIPWFKPGLFPRPTISGRILLILGILGLISILLSVTCYLLSINCALGAILWERTLWLQVGIAVMLSNIPAKAKKRKLFRAAGQIIDQNPDIIRIGITGSYGKSTTKEILVHLLKSHFGGENVCYNPANENNEVAIARLILKRADFFRKANGKTKILVIETGAYKKGEIATVCGFIKPHLGILTGLNQQHIELFGSQQAIAEAKFELPQAVSEKVFFNANSDRLVQLFEAKDITATKIPISTSAAQHLNTHLDRSEFALYGQDFTLPWPGAFFVENALLALECAREVGVPVSKLSQNLSKLAPLERALSLEMHPKGFAILKDTYSANVDGVLQAVKHLGNFSGRKVFVGLPLRELGDQAAQAHQIIFEALADIKAEVFWCRTDFAASGKSILGEKFHLLNSDAQSLTTLINDLGKEDAILLESKIPKAILKLLQV